MGGSGETAAGTLVPGGIRLPAELAKRINRPSALMIGAQESPAPPADGVTAELPAVTNWIGMARTLIGARAISSAKTAQHQNEKWPLIDKNLVFIGFTS